MSDQLRIGQMLYGFCCGAFGRDSYDDKRVEAIGADWVVCRTSRGHVAVYEGRPEYLLEFIYPQCWECDYQGPGVAGRPLNEPGAVCPRCHSEYKE